MKLRLMTVSMMLAMRSTPGIGVLPKGWAKLSLLPANEAPIRMMRPASWSAVTRPARRSAKEKLGKVSRGPR